MSNPFNLPQVEFSSKYKEENYCKQDVITFVNQGVLFLIHNKFANISKNIFSLSL